VMHRLDQLVGLGGEEAAGGQDFPVTPPHVPQPGKAERPPAPDREVVWPLLGPPALPLVEPVRRDQTPLLPELFPELVMHCLGPHVDGAVAAERGLGLDDGEFRAAYRANQQDTSATALESSVVVSQLIIFLKARPTWKGTAATLLEYLKTG